MMPDPAVHDLLRLAESDALIPGAGSPLPPWAAASLRAAPWVVVRRAPRPMDGLLPVGVRGRRRTERVAAWLPVDAVAQCLVPEQLSDRLPLLLHHRRGAVAALDALDRVRVVVQPSRIAWGPVGSVGFELATGTAATRPGSDLDLVMRMATPISRSAAAQLATALAALPVRADAQLETPHGAVSLGEYARDDGSVLLRTVNGPRLVTDPWQL